MLRLIVKIALAVVGLVLVYVGFTFAQVWLASRHDAASGDAAPASAIVVMGAAQWNGRPSPVLKARLDHAAELYQRGLAPYIVVTGGKQRGDRVTQGFAGYDYLRGIGVPESAIKVEVDGTNSYEELSASAVIVRNTGLPPDVYIVTDPYHALRVADIADEVGLTPHVSPTSTASSWRSFARETVAVAVGRIIGFRRLSNLA
jgi:uncharacterized SAM-binding protein YcdF (DUF218 family)